MNIDHAGQLYSCDMYHITHESPERPKMW